MLATNQKFHDRYGELQNEFERLGGYGREAQAKTILQGLGFKPGQWENSLESEQPAEMPQISPLHFFVATSQTPVSVSNCQYLFMCCGLKIK